MAEQPPIPKPLEPAGGMSAAAMKDMQAMMVAAFQAANAPTAEELEKREAEKARLRQRKLNMIRLVETEVAAKRRRQELCRHKKPDGEDCVGGQDMSNGKHVLICLRCQKVMSDQPTEEMVIAQTTLQRLAEQGKLKIVNGKIQVTEPLNT